MILKVLLLSIVIVAIAFVGFAITILIKKNGKFPELHIGRNEGLKKHGIYCAQTQDKLEQFEAKKKLQFKQLRMADREL
ncbi:MAG: hypothetical protein ACEPOZ_04270 [Marinifilaceae bacterium]